MSNPMIIGITGRKRSGKDTVAHFVDEIVMEDHGTSDELNEFAPHRNEPAHPRVVYRIAFAQPLKQICMQLFGWTEEHVNGSLKEVPDDRYPRRSNVKDWTAFRTELGTLVNYWFPNNPDRLEFKQSLSILMSKHSSVLQSQGPPVLTPRFAMQALGTEFGRWMSPNLWIDLALKKAQQAQQEDIVLITDVRFLNEAKAVRGAGGAIWRVMRPSVEPSPGQQDHASEEELMEIIPDLVIENSGTLEDLKYGTKLALLDLIGSIERSDPVGVPENVMSVLETMTPPPEEGTDPGRMTRLETGDVPYGEDDAD